MRPNLRVVSAVAVVGGGLAMTVLFQNCGKPMEAQKFGQDAFSSVGPQPQPQQQAPTGPGVSFADYSACVAGNTDVISIATCLNSKPGANNVYTAAQISTCFTAGQTTAVNLALCLSGNGQVVQNYRTAKQSDIDACLLANAANPAQCLANRGIGNGLLNDDLNACLNVAGASGIELCLHNRRKIANGLLMQSDVGMCTTLAQGQTTGVALCLHNSGLVPVTVTQPIVDSCITAVGIGSLAKCLRNRYFVSKALMQYHINQCNAAVGSAAIATCLNNNGLLPVDGTIPANVTAYQASINTCVTNVGVASVGKCLRNGGDLTPAIMQPHIAACFQTIGPSNTADCLAANFATVPAKLTNAELQLCFAANANTVANAAKCLASKYILDAAPSQAHVNACALHAGQVPDATGTLPGQIGIAACLAGNGMGPAILTQANIDSCITAVGLASASTCFHNRGYVPSFALMNGVGGVFTTSCAGCHSGNVLNGGVDITKHETVLAQLVQGNAAGSTLYTDVASGKMPTTATKLTAAQIAQIQLWINQGAAKN